MHNLKKIRSNFITYKYPFITVVLILLVVFFLQPNRNEEISDTKNVLPVVTVTSAEELSGLESISVVGTVRAFSEAVITAEATGRVTSVSAKLGQTVPAGYVIASLENASQQAAVLQAEGVYEAALAASEQSGISLDEANNLMRGARNDAVSTFVSSYNTVNNVVRNNIDDFFANPDSKVPGVKIDAKGQTAFLNSERVALQSLLSGWQAESIALNTDSDLVFALDNASKRIDRTIAIVDVFISLFNDDSPGNSYSGVELSTFSTSFINLRSTLQSIKSAINDDLISLENADDAIKRAQIGASGSQSSVADAQVKQALGSLRAAQANLAKSILRTPISGTVNSLDIRVGDFVSNQEVIARVANNNALEIVTFVGDNEKDAFTEGSTVTVADKYEGVVTEIAPAVDPLTRRTEVRIAVETSEIQNGDTVTVSKFFNREPDSNQPLTIPISAVKFEIEDGFIFVVENNILVSKPIEVGIVRGGSVEILSGLSSTEEFVVDARGLLADTEVEVRQQQ